MRAFARPLLALVVLASGAAPAQQPGSLSGNVTDENGAACRAPLPR